MANICHGFVRSPPSRALLVPAILTCGRDQHPACWRESSEQHCPPNHLVQWKAPSARKHTVSKPVITREHRCLSFQMRTTAPTKEFPSHCFCLASCEWHRLAAAHSQDHCNNHAIGVDDTWAEDLLLSGLHLYACFAHSKHWTQSFTRQLSFPKVEENHTGFINI